MDGLGRLGHLLCTANHIVRLATETWARAVTLCLFDATPIAGFTHPLANLDLGGVGHWCRRDLFLGGRGFGWRHVGGWLMGSGSEADVAERGWLGGS